MKRNKKPYDEIIKKSSLLLRKWCNPMFWRNSGSIFGRRREKWQLYIQRQINVCFTFHLHDWNWFFFKLVWCFTNLGDTNWIEALARAKPTAYAIVSLSNLQRGCYSSVKNISMTTRTTTSHTKRLLHHAKVQIELHFAHIISIVLPSANWIGHQSTYSRISGVGMRSSAPLFAVSATMNALRTSVLKKN